jgi:hypothetical protein
MRTRSLLMPNILAMFLIDSPEAYNRETRCLYSFGGDGFFFPRMEITSHGSYCPNHIAIKRVRGGANPPALRCPGHARSIACRGCRFFDCVRRLPTPTCYERRATGYVCQRVMGLYFLDNRAPALLTSAPWGMGAPSLQQGLHNWYGTWSERSGTATRADVHSRSLVQTRPKTFSFWKTRFGVGLRSAMLPAS